MLIPASRDNLPTVERSQFSVEFAGVVMTRAPVDHFAIGLLIKSEMIDPVKPTTSEKTSKLPRFSPVPYR